MATILQAVLGLLGLVSSALLLRDESDGELWLCVTLALASWEALRRSRHPFVQAAALAAAGTIVVLLAGA